MSGKNTHIYFFYCWYKDKRVWTEKIGKNEKTKRFHKKSTLKTLIFASYSPILKVQKFPLDMLILMQKSF